MKLRFIDSTYMDFSKGDIFELDCTVNGCNLFILLDSNLFADSYSREDADINLDIRYYYDPSRKYEYDKIDMLEFSFPAPFVVQSDSTAIVGNIFSPNIKLLNYGR